MGILEYTFFQNALIGSMLASIVCGLIGTYIVTRRLVFISGGITHASFGGIGLGVFLGINPILSAMIFAIASACGVEWMKQRNNVREDSAIALFWTFGMSIGIICCFLTPGFMTDLPSYLFGSILTIGYPDLILLAVLSIITILIFITSLRTIVSVAFDPVFARSQGIKVSTIEYLMMILTAITIVATLRIVGVVLAISLLTIPQMTANLFTFTFKKMTILSIFFGIIYCFCGLAISYWLNVPSGASIIFISIIIYAAIKLFKSVHSPAISILLLLITFAISGCSTQKNTSTSRWWHSFNARYNTFYNGHMAFIEGNLEKENGNKDNFTEMIPLYPVANKNSKDLGRANYDRTIEKCEKVIKQHSIKKRPEWTKNRRKTAKDVEWLNRKEYNPFIWKAWLLMGEAQFQKGMFDEAAATFSYMSRLYATQPVINAIARSWLTRCYTEQNWLYDAEDVITKQRRDSIHYKAVKVWDYAFADYYIHAAQYEKAIPYLRKVIKHERRKKQKARQWYLMGQLQSVLNNRTSAYKAFSKVISLNPPYELEFNARIAQTEVMAQGNIKKMINKLKRMAASDNNAEYLDQVYYAMGNIYLTQKDTVKAITAYEEGNKKAKRSGIEKGVLLLKLGDLYWNKEKYSDAKRCYGEAIGLLDKDRKDYDQMAQRSKVLDELVPHTDAIHLQDSLQALALMSDNDRNKAIDKVIEALLQKEKEEKKAAQEAEAEKVIQQQGANTGRPNPQRNTANNTTTQGAWYFYNPMAVNQGKATFQKQWGKRENVDDWQRVNHTVVAMNTTEQQQQETENNTDKKEKTPAEETTTTPEEERANDPHNREYYLAQIPFTDEQRAESNNIIKDALFASGVIFKDKLDNLKLSEKNLTRLVNHYPDYDKNDEAYYHLFLLYSRFGMQSEADNCLAQLKSKYATSQWTTLLADPYFIENARFGAHIEDSLYAATYNAFKADRWSEVNANTRLSAQRFPLGDNRAKFIFINGLSKLNAGDASGCITEMKEVIEKYPQSEVSEMAGMIVKGVQEGRPLHGGRFDIGDVWSRRDIALVAEKSTDTDTLSSERNTNFVFLLAYTPDSINENQMLYELARYNFTNFLVRNFDIAIDNQDVVHQMSIKGFLNYDEALQYGRQLMSNNVMRELTKNCRRIIISESNLRLLGSKYSYNDYAKFYEKTFAPLTISKEQLLNIPEEIKQQQEPERDEQNETPEDGIQNNNNTPANGDIDFDEDFF